MANQQSEWVAELQFLDFAPAEPVTPLLLLESGGALLWESGGMAHLEQGVAETLYQSEWVAQITFVDLLENQLLAFLSTNIVLGAPSLTCQSHVSDYYYDADDALYDLAEWA